MIPQASPTTGHRSATASHYRTPFARPHPQKTARSARTGRITPLCTGIGQSVRCGNHRTTRESDTWAMARTAARILRWDGPRASTTQEEEGRDANGEARARMADDGNQDKERGMHEAQQEGHHRGNLRGLHARPGGRMRAAAVGERPGTEAPSRRSRSSRPSSRPSSTAPKAPRTRTSTRTTIPARNTSTTYGTAGTRLRPNTLPKCAPCRTGRWCSARPPSTR